MKLIGGIALALLWTGGAQAAVETHCNGPAAQKMLGLYSAFADDILSGAHPERIGDYLAADVVWRDAPRGMPAGLEPMRRQYATINAAFPGHKVETRFALCAYSLLTVHQTLTGTNTGTLLGYPATGKSYSVRHSETYRFEGDRIREVWGEGLIPQVLIPIGWSLTWPGDTTTAAK